MTGELLLLGFGLPVMRFVARRAEELGYASLWTVQRVLDPVDARLDPTHRSVLDPRLWWVRAELRRDGSTDAAAAARAADLAARLARAYPQYRDQPFTRVLVLRVVAVTGWAAGERT